MNHRTAARIVKHIYEATRALDEAVAIAKESSSARSYEVRQVRRSVGESLGALYDLLDMIWSEHQDLEPPALRRPMPSRLFLPRRRSLTKRRKRA
jgi:hypothetical protein